MDERAWNARAPHRRSLDTEHAPGFSCREAQTLRQNERRALSRAESRERVIDLVLTIDGLIHVIGWGGPHHPPRGEHGASVSVSEQVHRRPVQVSRWVFHRTHPIPPLEDLEERVLGEVLGLGTASRNEAERPKQAIAFGFEELLERRCRRGDRPMPSVPRSVERHHVTHPGCSTPDGADPCRQACDDFRRTIAGGISEVLVEADVGSSPGRPRTPSHEQVGGGRRSTPQSSGASSVDCPSS